MACYKCELLAELYKQVPQTPRNYWVMTELFIFLHGSDVCDGDDEQTPREQMQQALRGGWVPVDERLPEEGEGVLTWRNGLCKIMYLRNDVWYHSASYTAYGALCVIPYWMPLPALPK